MTNNPATAFVARAPGQQSIPRSIPPLSSIVNKPQSLSPRQESSELLQHTLLEAPARSSNIVGFYLSGNAIDNSVSADQVQVRHGTQIHLTNALLCMVVPLLLFQRMVPLLSSYI